MRSIVLVHPEIPGNTGSIGRTCAALNQRLIIVGEAGFDLSEKAARRAGLDYWPFLELVRYKDFEEYLRLEKPEDFFLFSKRAKKVAFDAVFTKNCHLIFGCESLGLPMELQKQYAERLLCLPMLHSEVRSLNLANTATAVSYLALYQDHRLFHLGGGMNPPLK